MNPSFSTESLITGTVFSKQLFTRMFPCGVTKRNEPSDSEPDQPFDAPLRSGGSLGQPSGHKFAAVRMHEVQSDAAGIE